MTEQSPLEDGEDAVNVAYEFIKSLAFDLSKNDVALPSCPDVVMRVRKALEDEHCTNNKLAKIAGTEPVLAGRLLKLANSALIQRGGDSVTDIGSAVQRLGFTMVHNAAIALAMEQLFNAREFSWARDSVERLWQSSTRVAAVSRVLAQDCAPHLSSDEAFLTGLMHNIGKLYILTKAHKSEAFLRDRENLLLALDGWDGEIAGLIVEGWGFSEEQATAVKEYQMLDREPRRADLGDILQAATLLEQAHDGDADLEAICNMGACTRLGITPEKVVALIDDSNEEIRSLTQALG